MAQSPSSMFTYALVRGDLEMPPGKAAAQVAHAARLSLLRHIRSRPADADAFMDGNCCGSLVVLKGRGLPDLERAFAEAVEAGLPCALFEDSGHILPPRFNGCPIVTAFAAGPAPQSLLRPIFRRFRCL